MAFQFESARHQAALNTPTGYRRWFQFVFFRGGQSTELEPISGSFTQDARRAGRWDGRVSLVGNDIVPERPSDLLTPFGTRLEVRMGLELLDGSVSSVPFGTYEISSCKTQVRADQRTVDLGLIDMSNRIERYRFEAPFHVSTGVDLGEAVNRIVTNRIGVNPGVTPIGEVLNIGGRNFGLDPGTAPWEEILDMLKGVGFAAWYDRVGEIQVGAVGTPDPEVAYPLDQLTSKSADFDAQPPNVIVVRGETQDGIPPVQAVAMDTDPSSPTYAGTGPGTSPYGRVTQFYASPMIRTLPIANVVAKMLLAQRIGAGATRTLVRPYDPTIDPGDVVSLSGSTYAVDAVTVDLAGETTIQAREL